MSHRSHLFAAVACALVMAGAGSPALAQGTAVPRPGLTAQQTRTAVTVARDKMAELRRQTPGAEQPGADRREFVVGVELLATKEPAPGPAKAGDQGATESGNPASTKPDDGGQGAAPRRAGRWRWSPPTGTSMT